MEKEKTLLTATVCLLIKNKRVLLGMKTKKIGAGCWNGYGGGIKENESLIQTAIRELEEETGRKNKGKKGETYITASPKNLEKVAIMDFHNTKTDGTTFVCKVHFFLVKKWRGKPVNTEEMIDHTFFDIHDLPLSRMMLADKKYFHLILGGKKIIGTAKYGPFQKELLEEPIIEEVYSFPESF